jgi:hypothetical protein
MVLLMKQVYQCLIYFFVTTQLALLWTAQFIPVYTWGYSHPPLPHFTIDPKFCVLAVACVQGLVIAYCATENAIRLFASRKESP